MFSIRDITDRFIGGSIFTGKNFARKKLEDMQNAWKINMFISIVLDASIIGISLISYHLFSVTKGVVLIISFLVVILTAFRMYRFAKNLWTLISHWAIFSEIFLDFFNSFTTYHSPALALKNTISIVYRGLYELALPGVFQKIHKAGTNLGLIKGKGEIGSSIVKEFYPLVKDYLIGVLIYNIMAATVFYGIFVLILRQYIFTHIIHQGFFNLLFYPFSVVIPAILRII